MTEGDRSGAYVIGPLLGRGAGTATWAATADATADLPYEIPSSGIVLKILDLGEASDWSVVDVLKREANILKSLSHPGIPRYLDYFEDRSDGERLVLVMERIDGEDLNALVANGRRFGEVEIEAILADLADILAYLGGLRPPVVHGDVTPRNLILRADGGIFLVDFSGAQDYLRVATSPGGAAVGTAGYAPAEQVAGRASHRSDLFGAAATALFLLTGKNPADLPQKGTKPDISILPGLSARLSAVLAAWLEPEESRRDLPADRAASILRGLAGVTPRPAPIASLPSDSRILIEEGQDRLRVEIPAAGLRAGAALPLGGFALFWLAFVGFWTFSAISMGAPIFFVLFSLPFWGAGVFMAGSTIKSIFGSVELLVAGREGLIITERIPGRTRRRAWPLADIGRCALEKARIRSKGGEEEEIVIEAGVSRIRFGQALSPRELRTLAALIDARIVALKVEAGLTIS
jgi:hypothetical protein